MPLPIEDYAFLSDLESAALVGKDGSIDWLTFPRFDSPACFAALLGGPEHGRWLLAPTGGVRKVSRRYRGHSLVLETTFTTDDGVVTIVDCMPPRDKHLEVIRLVHGDKGRVPMRMELIVRFDYGSIVPWVRHLDDGSWQAVGGPDSLRLHSPVDVRGENMTTVADFVIGEGDVVAFTLSWHPPHETTREVVDPVGEVASAERWWYRWSRKDDYTGEWADEVGASLAVLKGLTYSPTGGLVAAASTSLPEQLGGPRNWDYRYCWLRDATYTLLALIAAGNRAEVPLVGFLPSDDQRVRNTVDAIERELTVDGFVVRYLTRESLDGLPPGEGAFLLCTFWLAQARAMLGQPDEARGLFERLLGLRNDVGLLAEEYDPATGGALGNVPQAFSHTALVNTAMTLTGHGGERSSRIPAV